MTTLKPLTELGVLNNCSRMLVTSRSVYLYTLIDDIDGLRFCRSTVTVLMCVVNNISSNNKRSVSLNMKYQKA